MSPHPTITAALADQHRRDLTARAEAYRLVRAARSSHPRSAHHMADPMKITRQLITALRRAVIRLPLVKAPATFPQPRLPVSAVPAARLSGDLGEHDLLYMVSTASAASLHPAPVSLDQCRAPRDRHRLTSTGEGSS